MRVGRFRAEPARAKLAYVPPSRWEQRFGRADLPARVERGRAGPARAQHGRVNASRVCRVELIDDFLAQAGSGGSLSCLIRVKQS